MSRVTYADDGASLPGFKHRAHRWPSGSTTGAGLKRAIDVVVTALALLLLSPGMVVVYVAIRVSSRGGGLFRQVRVGADRKPFVMYKFRTMRDGCEEGLHREYVGQLLAGEAPAHGGLYKLEGDPRVTRIGSWLRRSSIDELPQLVNILRGEMSLVGPRPVLPWEVEMFPEWALSRFTVRPGLTGLWQVSGRNRLTMLEALQLDTEYVARRSLLLDLTILVKTVPAVLFQGAR